MASLPASVHQVQEHMSHFAVTKNNPFDGNYAAALVTYKVDVVVPTNAPAPNTLRNLKVLNRFNWIKFSFVQYDENRAFVLLTAPFPH